jgi:DNA-binding transcriptional ArsR family regulator
VFDERSRDERFVLLKSGAMALLSEHVAAGRLMPGDVQVALTVANAIRVPDGTVVLSVRSLAAAVGTKSLARVSYSLRRLRACGLVVAVDKIRSWSTRWTVSPLLATVGGEGCRRRHQRLFAAALRQQEAPLPLPASAIKWRHAKPCQLAPAA